MTPLRNIVKRYWDTLGYPFSHTSIKSRYKHATAVSGAAKVARLGTFVSELMQVDLLTYSLMLTLVADSFLTYNSNMEVESFKYSSVSSMQVSAPHLP